MTGCGAPGRVGPVHGALGPVEAQLDQQPGRVDAVAGLEVRELSIHGVDQEADDEASVPGFLGDDVG